MSFPRDASRTPEHQAIYKGPEIDNRRRSILILGASSDIARAIAKKFASEGWDLLLAGRDPELLSRDAADLKLRYAVDAKSLKFDALDFDSHVAFWSGIDPEPSAVACVFGYLGDQKVSERNWDETRKAIDTNYTCAVSILNIIANDYESRKEGLIIGVSSVAGDRGRMSNYIYGSAKAGFTAYLSGLRGRLSKSGVNVMTVKPGFVATRMTENMNIPGIVTATPDQVATDIFRAHRKSKSVVYTRWFWRYIMLAIIHIPESVFSKMKL
ncbi:MAG: SDR family oxidoreductase [Bacteroidetes bacterium]|nr:SDR family oxidoreductase [Bacteroidota bacterium]